MNQEVSISICIPARNRSAGLIRLMNSILIQTFKNYEVVIQDNSDENEIQELYEKKYSELEFIHYYRNNEVLNMGANWNACISHATYDWIKMMHDDDWFVNENSLNIMADALSRSSKLAHTFAYFNVWETGITKMVKLNKWIFRIYQLFPFYIYKNNYIGNPCCTVIHRSCKPIYKDQLKWLVDVHYYLQLSMEGIKFAYHSDPVINIGISNNQATLLYKNNIEVELREHDIMASDFGGYGYFKSYFVFDTLWRLVRNTGLGGIWQHILIRNSDLTKALNYCILNQKKIDKSLLRKKIFSGIIKPCLYLFYR